MDNRDCPVDFPATAIRQLNGNDIGGDRSVRTFKSGKTVCNLLRIQLERGLLAAGRPNEFRALLFNQAINRILHIMVGLIVALHRYSLYAYKLCRVGNFRRGASNIDNRDCPIDFPAAVIRQRNSNDTGADRSVRTFKGGKTFCNLLRIQLERGLLAAGRPNEFRALLFNQAINRILHIMAGLIVALHRYSLYAYKLRRVGDIGLGLLLPNRIDGLGRILPSQRDRIAAPVIRLGSILAISPAKEVVAFAAGQRLAINRVRVTGVRCGSILDVPLGAASPNIVKIVIQMVSVLLRLIRLKCAAGFFYGFEIFRENRHRQRAKEHDQRQKRR